MGRRLPTVIAAVLAIATALVAPAAASSTATRPALDRLGIKHVFVIVLENKSYAAAYRHNPHHYLGRTLQRQGTLLTRYYAVGHESNDNYLAMISGQAPNVQTQADCQDYVDFTPSPAPLDDHGQAVGSGCVYPANVPTLPNQLQAKGVRWRGYMQDMGNDPSREPSTCGQPGPSAGAGTRDGTQKATATDQYAARHNPFVYFHSLLDNGLCARHVVPLTQLRPALRHAASVPGLSFITPNLCNDGHDHPCIGKDSKGSSAGGLASADHFLKTWVPRIEHSPGFHAHDLLVITADESDTGDASACCGEQPGPGSPYPGAANGHGTGKGGGRIGTLLIGRCVRHGATDSRRYNHYSLLRSLENMFGITTGGTDGHGHLGFAGVAGPKAFGSDAFASCRKKFRTSAAVAAADARPTTGSAGGAGNEDVALAVVGLVGISGLVLVPILLRRRRGPHAGSGG